MLRQEWSSRREKNRQFERQLAIAGQNLTPVRAKRRLLGKAPGPGTGALAWGLGLGPGALAMAMAEAPDGGSYQRQLQLGCGLGCGLASGLAPKRSSCITLVQAETKSATNRSAASLWA